MRWQAQGVAEPYVEEESARFVDGRSRKIVEGECEAYGDKGGIETLAEHEAELREREDVYQHDEEEEDLKPLLLPKLCDSCVDVSAKRERGHDQPHCEA